MPQTREIIFEFHRVGGYVKFSAFDTLTSAEVSIVGPPSAGQVELEEELVALMQSAVRSRMVADVPLGAFLSGGVDSSAVVALMAEASKRAVNTCTIGFDVDTLDETDYAERVAKRFATDHRTLNNGRAEVRARRYPYGEDW